MPEVSRFFGIIISTLEVKSCANLARNKALFDFQGNIIKGNLSSRTATKLVREWIDLHVSELEEDWRLARESKKIRKIEPLT